MGQFDKCLLLLVRSDNDIPRACKEAGEFLAFRDAPFPTIHEEHDDEFVGIWVDPLGVDTPPELLGRTSASGHRVFRTSGSFGSSGIWLLCWFDAALGSSSVDLGALRESLVLALIEQRTFHQHHTAPQFAPVFDAADGLAHIWLQTERLRILFPELIGEPLTWNRTSGSIRRVDEFEHAEASSEVDD
ncbi:hypothetical protein [Methylocystis rosea]|uniref:Uncharacterized protein n=1 Tax=Methylocystis rosea TaxID=173366 RepID=A0A3G8M4C1_9HYPH|nr:hypothetical protein [Methylocystis rosea]AZG75890.1 hypothetical protein EHO51_03585 [Methylocystis rosea]